MILGCSLCKKLSHKRKHKIADLIRRFGSWGHNNLMHDPCVHNNETCTEWRKKVKEDKPDDEMGG